VAPTGAKSAAAISEQDADVLGVGHGEVAISVHVEISDGDRAGGLDRRHR